MRALACAVVAALALTTSAGCATAPFFRPQGPPLDDKVAEIGVGPHVMFGREQMGVGAGAWAHAQVAHDVQLLFRGYGTDFFGYDGKGQVLDDVLVGGSAGIRGVYRYKPTFLLGGEAMVDYQLRTATGGRQQLLSGIVGLPVAEEALPGFWVYTNPSLGIAIVLDEDPDVPFFGFQEIPIGVSWQVTPWLVLVAEGGFALPLNGGYGGAAVAFRF